MTCILTSILEVNAITAALFTSDVLEKSSAKSAPERTFDQTAISDEKAVSIDDWSSGLEETDDSSLYFSPDLGNVVFSSAIDGWGFRYGVVCMAPRKVAIIIRMHGPQSTLWMCLMLDPRVYCKYYTLIMYGGPCVGEVNI